MITGGDPKGGVKKGQGGGVVVMAGLQTTKLHCMTANGETRKTTK